MGMEQDVYINLGPGLYRPDQVNTTQIPDLRPILDSYYGWLTSLPWRPEFFDGPNHWRYMPRIAPAQKAQLTPGGIDYSPAIPFLEAPYTVLTQIANGDISPTPDCLDVERKRRLATRGLMRILELLYLMGQNQIAWFDPWWRLTKSQEASYYTGARRGEYEYAKVDFSPKKTKLHLNWSQHHRERFMQFYPGSTSLRSQLRIDLSRPTLRTEIIEMDFSVEKLTLVNDDESINEIAEVKIVDGLLGPNKHHLRILECGYYESENCLLSLMNGLNIGFLFRRNTDIPEEFLANNSSAGHNK